MTDYISQNNNTTAYFMEYCLPQCNSLKLSFHVWYFSFYYSHYLLGMQNSYFGKLEQKCKITIFTLAFKSLRFLLFGWFFCIYLIKSIQ